MIILSITSFLLQHYYFYTTTNILQNQYYEIKRFFYYKMKNKALFILKIIFIFLSVVLVRLNKYFYILYTFFFFNLIKNKIVKFKFTKRVLRLFIIFEINNIIIFICSIYYKNLFISIVLNIILYWFSFFISFLIEKIILNHYKKKAIEKVKKYGVKVIAITGSYGKTSVKNYVYELIKDKYNVLMSKKSFNTINGVLLTINNDLKPYHEFLILELGVDKKNGMNKFISLFPFYISVVTSIGPQHLKTFKTIDNIKKEKLKIFTNATYFIVKNLDDCYIKDYTTNKNVFNVSNEKETDLLVTYNNNILRIKYDENVYFTTTSLLGKHNIKNLSLAIAVALLLNIEIESIINNVGQIKNVSHRLSLINKGCWQIIDDSYNSNYEGMLNALDVLKSFNGFKVLITPGIIETKLSDNQNDQIVRKINETVDLALLINHPLFEKGINKYLAFTSFKEAYAYLESNYKNDSLIILIANDLPDIYLK